MSDNIIWRYKDPALDIYPLDKQDIRAIKERPHRKVFRGKNIFVKAFRPGTIELLAKRDVAKKEFDLSRLLFGKNRAPRPLGYGISGPWRLFVSERIRGVSLESFLSGIWPALGHHDKDTWLLRFSFLLKDLAAAGIIQPDFHLANLFIDNGNDDYVLIDLQRVEYTARPLSRVEACEQLRYVFPPFAKYLTRYELLRALSYIKRWLPEVGRQSCRFFLQQVADKDIRRHSLKKLPRYLSKNTVYRSHSGLRVFRAIPVDDRFVEGAKEVVLAGIKGLRTNNKILVIKNSRHTLCLKLDLSGKEFFIKCYRSSGNLKSLSYLLRRPRSIKSWNASFYLDYVGVGTVSPLFLIQANNPWREIYGLVAYPWIEGISNTKDTVVGLCRLASCRRFFFERIAMFMWDMHEKGVFHGDCKITNFMVAEGGRKIAVFDLDSAKLVPKVPDRFRIRDICVMGRSLKEIAGSKEEVFHLLLSAYCRYHIPWQRRFSQVLSTVIKSCK